MSVAALSLTLLVACGGASGVTQQQPGASGAGLTAIAAVYPLAWIVQAIAPGASVDYLAARGQDPHDLELSPQQHASVESAAVVAYMGDIGFQPQVEAAVANAAGEVVDVAQVVGEQSLLEFAAGAYSDEQDERAIDPHVWFDAGLMAQVAEQIGEAFAAADPANADTYVANATDVAEQLSELDGELADMLTGCADDEVIVSHEAYAYLLEPNGLSQHGVSGAGGHGGANPQQIADLAARVKDEGIPAVLTEPVEGRADAETVAREADVELIDVYSLDIVTQEQAARGYPDLLHEQAGAVARAARCE